MNNPCGNNECNKINIGIDECIKQLIKALNDCGMETVASCCGHGNTNGNVALSDGRELIIVPDYETARAIEKYFPDIHGEKAKNTHLEIHKLANIMGREFGDKVGRFLKQYAIQINNEFNNQQSIGGYQPVASEDCSNPPKTK